MSQGEPFDFRKIMQNVDPAAKGQVFREGIYDHFEIINARLSPMIWALAWDEMVKAKGDPMVLNAVLNAVVSAVTVFAVSCMEDEAFLEEMIDKMAVNMRNCFAQRLEARELVCTNAQGHGRALLLERAVPGMRDCVSQTGEGLAGLSKMMVELAKMVQDLKNRGGA